MRNCKTIPLSLHVKKDKRIIDLLEEKTNKSAYIREIIYAYLDGIPFEKKQNDTNKENSEFDNPSNANMLAGIMKMKNKNN